MKDDVKKMNGELVAVYKKWWAEVKEKGFDDAKFSNPFYSGIPDNWSDGKIRILICGEEGYGCWMKDGSYDESGKWDENKKIAPDDIEKLQKNNLGYVNGTRQRSFKTNQSAFWRRFKQFEYLDEDLSIKDIYEPSSIPVIWSNCDKICDAYCSYNKRNGKLSDNDRKRLHSVETKILSEEIRIFKPTHIVFLGWYTLSAITDNGLSNYTKFMKMGDKYNYPLDIQQTVDGKKVYYLYHPGYFRVAKAYQKDVAAAIEDIKADWNFTFLK